VPKTEEFIQWDVFGEGTSSELRLPRTSSKVVVTKMLLKNRETGIIGGLMKDKVTNSESAVPFFSDIPVLGRAFKSNTSAQSKENVLIFITPTIIGPRSEDNFREDLDSMRDMAENFGEVGGLDLPDDDE
jgi:type II secretory pathway component GspD/PulD (secretin)